MSKKRLSDKERFMECLRCPYAVRCEREVPNPEEYEDGSCKTLKLFLNGTMDFHRVEGY